MKSPRVEGLAEKPVGAQLQGEHLVLLVDIGGRQKNEGQRPQTARWDRISRQSWYPSMTGIRMSEITRSQVPSSSISRAFFPLDASATVCPLAREQACQQVAIVFLVVDDQDVHGVLRALRDIFPGP